MNNFTLHEFESKDISMSLSFSLRTKINTKFNHKSIYSIKSIIDPILFQFVKCGFERSLTLDERYQEYIVGCEIIIQKQFNGMCCGILFINIETSLLNTIDHLFNVSDESITNQASLVGILNSNEEIWVNNIKSFIQLSDNYKYQITSFVQTSKEINMFVNKTIRYLLSEIDIKSIYGIGGAVSQYIYHLHGTVPIQLITNSSSIHSNNQLNGYSSTLLHKYHNDNILSNEWNDVVIVNIGKKGLRKLTEAFLDFRTCPKHILYIGCMIQYNENDVSQLLKSGLYIKKREYKCESINIYHLVRRTTILKSQTHHISLGKDCAIAYNLRRLGLRERAYPFDFISTKSIDSVINCLKDEFNNFLPSKYKLNLNTIRTDKYVNIETMEPSTHYIVKNIYGMRFVHDFTDLSEKTYNIKKNAFLRRIERFRNISIKKVVFYRTTERVSKVFVEKILELIGILRDNYGFKNAQYKILIKSNDKRQQPYIDALQEIQNIDCLVVSEVYENWMCVNYDWESIFMVNDPSIKKCKTLFIEDSI